MKARLTPRIALLLTLPPLFWAGNAVVGRALVGQVPPLALNALRWWIALALLLPFAWRVLSRPALIVERAPYLALLGLFGVGSYNALQYMAVQTSTPINTTLIASSMPLWMLLVGALFWRERPRPAQLLGAALSLAGVLLVVTRGQPAALVRLEPLPGDLYMLGAAALWSGYSWLLARPPQSMQGERRPDWDWAAFLLAQMLFGLLWSSTGALAEALWWPQPFVASPGVFAALLYVAIFPSLLAYRAWGLGIAAVGPAIPAFFANLTPVFAALLSAALLGEVPHTYHAVAFVLIGAGIVASARR